MKSDGQERPGGWWAEFGPGGGERAERQAGRAVLVPGPINSDVFLLFFLFFRSIFNRVLNGFIYSLISIQFCTNVFIV